ASDSGSAELIPPQPNFAGEPFVIEAHALLYGVVTYEYEATNAPRTGGTTAAKAKTKKPGIPKPGKSVTSVFSIDKSSKQGTVIASGDSITDLIFGVIEKPRPKKLSRLQKLKGIRWKLETTCFHVLGVTLDVEFSANTGGLQGTNSKHLAPTCKLLLDTVQERIKELEAAREAETVTGNELACKALRFRLRAERTDDGLTTRVVKKGVKPRLKVTCSRTGDALRVNLRATGKRTLRQALGKRLKLTFRQSESAPAPDGSKLTVSFTQSRG
ncbi:MAG: hypothetical protein ACR2OD_01025, partial [Gaiellaceae bacterium]